MTYILALRIMSIHIQFKKRLVRIALSALSIWIQLSTYSNNRKNLEINLKIKVYEFNASLNQ